MSFLVKPEVVGHITFDNKTLDVYVSLDNSIFKASDIATMIEYIGTRRLDVEEDET